MSHKKKAVQRRHKRKINYSRVLLALIVLVLVAFGAYKGVNQLASNIFGTNQNESIADEFIPVIPEDSVANIVAIGDTLCHSQNFQDAYDSTTKIYDFSSFFKNITQYFDATVCVGNLEATLAGPSRGYSGYPTFNTPEHLAIDLKELGLDVMTTANNHTLDLGYSGLESTLKYLDEAGLEHTGSARSEEEQNTILFKDLNGIRTAFLAFTYGTNGIPVPTGKEYCVNLIDKELIKKQIDKAKEEGAELICVSMHWGVEYRTTATKEQEELADFLIENGVQVILGCHPHVPEPMEMRTVKLEDGTTKTGFVIYSMGNFFSAQTFPNTRNTLILNVQVRKNGATGEISIDNATYTPLYMYDNGTSAKDRYELLDLEKVIEEYEEGNSKWSKTQYELAKTELKRHLSLFGPEIFNNTDENS